MDELIMQLGNKQIVKRPVYQTIVVLKVKSDNTCEW